MDATIEIKTLSGEAQGQTRVSARTVARTRMFAGILGRSAAAAVRPLAPEIPADTGGFVPTAGFVGTNPNRVATDAPCGQAASRKRLSASRISSEVVVPSALARSRSWSRNSSPWIARSAHEACSLGLAPTASTTTMLALGDALAVALSERRGFKEEDFANLHPGGKLGKRFARASSLMHSGDARSSRRAGYADGRR